MTSDRPRILIIDDDRAFRIGTGALLNCNDARIPGFPTLPAGGSMVGGTAIVTGISNTCWNGEVRAQGPNLCNHFLSNSVAKALSFASAQPRASRPVFDFFSPQNAGTRFAGSGSVV